MSMLQDMPVSVNPGDVLAGKYRVERVLGVGGMGIVVAAHHIQLDQKVALKFLLPHALGEPEAVARFVREARAAVKIQSEHVARISDVGELENGAPYMVMEFLQGGDLAAWLRQNGPLPYEQAVDFVLQTCVAVADAHALGIVHRDLKPANLFCVRRSDGQLLIKVLDFGISKMTNAALSARGADMTKTSALMGTPLYMSPEQMRSSRDVDSTTDIWALGVILFELITGKPPFHGETVTELVMKVATDPAPLLRPFRPDAPSGLDAIVAKCLEKDRAKRYVNVGELSLALLPFAPKRAKAWVERISGILQAAGLSQSALAVPVSPSPAGRQTSTGTLPALERTTAGASRVRSRTFRVAAGAVLVAGGAIAGAMLLGAHRKDGHDAGQAASSGLAQASSSGVEPLPAAATLTPPPDPSPSSAPVPTPSPSPIQHRTPMPTPTRAPVQTQAPHRTETANPNPNPTPAANPAPTPPPTPAPNCTPPYVIDANGDRQYKPECLRH